MIGAPTREKDVKEETRLVRSCLVANVPEPVDLQRLWQGAGGITDGAEAVLQAMSRVLGRSRRDAEATVVSAGGQLDGGAGLRYLLNQFHDAARLDYRGSLINIAVPYTHLIFLTGQSPSDYTTIEEDLAREMAEEFGPYIDPSMGARVRFFRAGSNYPPGTTRCFFGAGVYLPDLQVSNEAMVSMAEDVLCGLVQLRRDETSPIFYPRLPNGAPAAFYTGQKGLTFSGHNTVTAATCEDVLASETLEYGSRFFIGRLGETEPASLHAMLDRDTIPGGQKVWYEITDGDGQSFSQKIDNVEPGVWHTVSRRTGASPEPVFQIRYTPDGCRRNRYYPVSRLSGEPPWHPYLELVSIAVPDPTRMPELESVWVNFTSLGDFVTSNISVADYAVVFGALGDIGTFVRRVQRYDNETAAQLGGSGPVRVSVPQAQLELTAVRETAADGEPVIVIERVDGGSLGTIRLPDPDAFETFEITTAGTSKLERVSIDWLDLAVMVEKSPWTSLGGGDETAVMGRRSFLGLGSYAPQTHGYRYEQDATRLVGRDGAVSPGERTEIGRLGVVFRS